MNAEFDVLSDYIQQESLEAFEYHYSCPRRLDLAGHRHARWAFPTHLPAVEPAIQLWRIWRGALVNMEATCAAHDTTDCGPANRVWLPVSVGTICPAAGHTEGF